LLKVGVLGTEGSGRLTFVTHMRLTATAAGGENKAEQEARLSNAEMYSEIMQNVVLSTRKILDKSEDSVDHESATKIKELTVPVSSNKFGEVKTWTQSLFQDEKWNSKLEELKWTCFDEYQSVKYCLPKLESLSDDYKFEGREKVMSHGYKIRREHTGFVDYAFSFQGKKLDFSYPHQVRFKKWLPMFLSSVSCMLFFVDMARICGSSETDFLCDGVQVFEKTLQNLPKGPVQLFLVLSKYDLFEKIVSDGIPALSLSLSGFGGNVSSATEISSYVVDQHKAILKKYGSPLLRETTLRNLDQASVQSLMELLSSSIPK